MGTSYENDIYYSLKDGVVATIPRTNWDISFSTDPRSSSILTNGGSGVELYVYPVTANWTDPFDTTGISSWTILQNSDTTWEDGAFSRNATGHPNYGWGIYNGTTHNLEGAAYYIIKLQNGDFKKIFIDDKQSVSLIYDFRYANLDGTNEQIVNLDVSGATDKSYMYYSLTNNQQVDREPASWDLLFTRYYSEEANYFVTGVLSRVGILSVEKSGIEPASATYTEDEFSPNISEIGYDWKSFDMGTFTYSVVDQLSYFIKNTEGSVYQIQFTGFEGSATGNLAFNSQEIK